MPSARGPIRIGQFTSSEQAEIAAAAARSMSFSPDPQNVPEDAIYHWSVGDEGRANEIVLRHLDTLLYEDLAAAIHSGRATWALEYKLVEVCMNLWLLAEAVRH